MIRRIRHPAFLASTMAAIVVGYLMAGKVETPTAVPIAAVLPFGGLLLAIALLPLALSGFWDDHVNKATVSLLLALPVAIYLMRISPAALAQSGLEYLAFMSLLGSLFVISGGVVLRGDIRATPAVNAAFLGCGVLLANLVGTTGASMLLIRPLLRTNSERRKVAHLPLFFIFIVSNAAGCLTPLGDPPLFLGYLRGVPFLWGFRLVPLWLTVNGTLLGIFYFWDRRAYQAETPAALRADALQVQPLRLAGGLGLVWVSGVLALVIIQQPLGHWFGPMLGHTAGDVLSKLIGAGGMLFLSWGAWRTTPRSLRAENGFSFAPIAEVAILFAGIFITMVPALDLLQLKGPELAIRQPWQFFWSTGLLSSFLDNAPTYVTFLKLAQSLKLSGPGVIGVPHRWLMAISAGAVFMGANTYVGNGPNFMVKSIAEQAGVRMPGFLGYMVYSALILTPIFGLVTCIFFL